MAQQSGMAAGATAGAAFGPWGAAIGAVAGGVSDAVNASMAGPFMGGNSEAMAYGTTFDTSGWIVNGSGQQNATASPVRTTAYGPAPGTDQAGFLAPVHAGLGGMSGTQLLLAGVVIVLAIKLARRK